MNTAATSPHNQHAASEALGLWEPKRTLTLEAARRHSDRIRLLRRLLMVFAGLLLIAVVVQFLTQRASVIMADNPTESVKMVNPRYSGRTDDGLPFYLTADTATRTLANRSEVALINPVLEFIRETGVESSYVEALEGTYDDVNKILNLRQEVQLETDDGYICKTIHARIFARAKRIEGDEPINCVGNFGSVNGKKYAIEDNYKTFIFKSGMDAVIVRDPNAAGNDSAQSDEPVDGALFSFGGDGPIKIIAEQATYQGNITDLEGKVDVRQDGAIINSDFMKITRQQQDLQSAGTIKLGAIQTITARDNFRYRTTENDVRGERGVYDRAKSLFNVTGNVKIRQPSGNTVDTDRLTYNVKTETIRYSGNCQGRECGDNGRSKTVISGGK